MYKSTHSEYKAGIKYILISMANKVQEEILNGENTVSGEV